MGAGSRMAESRRLLKRTLPREDAQERRNDTLDKGIWCVKHRGLRKDWRDVGCGHDQVLEKARQDVEFKCVQARHSSSYRNEFKHDKISGPDVQPGEGPAVQLPDQKRSWNKTRRVSVLGGRVCFFEKKKKDGRGVGRP